MQADRAKTVAALVTMAAALLALYFSLREAPPQFDGRPQEGLGQVLGEEAAKLVGSGGRIALISRDTSAVINPATQWQVKGLVEALRKANLTISITNRIKQDPLRLVRVPPGEFLQLIKKHSEGDVIVSLMGPPLLTSEQRAGLPEKGPRSVAVCVGAMPAQVNLRELFRQDLVQVAVTSRTQSGPEPVPSSNLRAWFDQLYQIVTATNVAELPLVTNSLAP